VASDTTNVCWNVDSAFLMSSDTLGILLLLLVPPSSDNSPEFLTELFESLLDVPGFAFGSSPPEVRTLTPCGLPVSSSVFSTRPHSAALFVATPISPDSCCFGFFSSCWDCGRGGGVGTGSLRAIHEVVMGASSGSGSFLALESTQLFQVGFDERNAGLVGRFK